MKVARTKCDCCGREMPKAKRVFAGAAYCETCYAREFVVVNCRECLNRCRVLKSVGHGICAKCNQRLRLCIRCKRPVPRAALITAEGAVCPGCRKHFEPFPPKKKRPEGFATCARCRRFREVDSFNEQRRPVCKSCRDPDNAERVAAETEAYWLARIIREAEDYKNSLNHNAWRTLFVRFVVELQESKDLTRAALSLPKYYGDFRMLDDLVDDPSKVSAVLLDGTITAAERRRAQKVMTFIHAQGFVLPTPSAVSAASERRRIQQILSEVKDLKHGCTVSSFVDTALNTSVGNAPRTARLATRAAAELAKHVGDASIAPAKLISFLHERPGYRASLFSFVKYLAANGYPELSMPPKKTTPVNPPARLDNQMPNVISFTESAANFSDRRSSIVGALIAMSGVTLSEVTQMKRASVTLADSGRIVINLKEKNIAIPDRFAGAIREYLRLLEDKYGRECFYLFPGGTGQFPVSEEAVSQRLRRMGLVASKLARSARMAIVEAVR